MKRWIAVWLGVWLSLAMARNDVPSCYQALKLHEADTTPDKALFILVDQTTPLDKPMMIYTYKTMMRFLRNGNSVSIASFSSNANGKYTEAAFSGRLEHLLPQEATRDISKKILRKYKGCMNAQYRYAKKKATKALVRVLKGANKSLPHSDILKSLSDISEHLIKPKPAKEKTVLLVSDMMEHSSITSFYHKGRLKRIDTAKELAKVKQSGFVADFDGARVYVIGAGATSNKKSYRDSKTLKRLSDFWTAYFKIANAKLQAIGTPMLLDDIAP